MKRCFWVILIAIAACYSTQAQEIKDAKVDRKVAKMNKKEEEHKVALRHGNTKHNVVKARKKATKAYKKEDKADKAEYKLEKKK